MVKISFWTDYSCPFCYIAEKRIDNLAKDMGVEVEFDFHSFELYPDAPKDTIEDTTTRFARKYHLTKEGALRNINSISNLGIKEGLDFKYETTQNTNTMDAHRLTQYVKSLNNPKLTKEFSDLVFKAYFSDNLKLADHNVLLNIAKELNLNLDECKDVLNSDKFKDIVINDEKFIISKGIHAVPFFQIGDIEIVGAQSREIFKNAINMDINNNLNQGLSCGINGCDL